MAPVAIAIWSLALKPSKEPVSFIPQSDLRITNIALGDELADITGRSSVKLTYETPVKIGDDDDEEMEPIDPTSTTVLGSLTPGKIEQATVDLILEQDEEYLLELVGKNTIYLTGNYIDQTPPDQFPYDGESDSDDMDEGAYDLREVSSDVEIAPEDVELDSDSDDAGRFEEILEEKSVPDSKKASKRAREEDTSIDAEADTSMSKTAQKKLNKKLKAEGGAAVAAGTVEGEKKSKKEKKEKKKENGAEAPKEKLLDGGVKIKDVKIGQGVQAKKGSRVSMRYVGKLTDGKQFDANTKGTPFSFVIGKGEVIKGWDVGIAGMAVGGERQLTIPPAMGYGNKKSGPIPAGSTLLFECKLLSIK